MNKKQIFWAGSEDDLKGYLSLMTVENLTAFAGKLDQTETAQERPYRMQGSTAVLDIAGPMIASDNPFAEMFGYTTYPSLLRKLDAISKDAEVTDVILAIDSGGGAVSGLTAVAQKIRQVSAEGKPVTAFSEGHMLSAAYWLGSSADKIVVDKSAVVGSIGVIAHHYEESQALANEGIKATVLRAGQYKALASSVEPLSDAARAQIQDGLDHAYGMFVDHVAQARGVSYPVADSTMAQGRVFYGQQAQAIGLVDCIDSFSSLFQPVTSVANKGVSYMNVETQTTEAVVPVVENPQAKVEDSGLVAELRSQLTAVTEARIQAEVNLRTLQQQQASVADAVTEAKLVLAGTANNMRVALGQPMIEDFASVDFAGVVALHNQLSAQFATTFPVGGLAVGAQADESKPQATIDVNHAARLRAVTTRF